MARGDFLEKKKSLQEANRTIQSTLEKYVTATSIGGLVLSAQLIFLFDENSSDFLKILSSITVTLFSLSTISSVVSVIITKKLNDVYLRLMKNDDELDFSIRYSVEILSNDRILYLEKMHEFLSSISIIFCSIGFVIGIICLIIKIWS
ncbi:hypothetical protein [Oceanibaculum indicum]|uniref:hypothetical protein n=1 Tax=Oceanibaculum indicum TaxID=526216 RepID=UPI0012EA5590|nr:hypothetical protein [Oceanibaculum indicum]